MKEQLKATTRRMIPILAQIVQRYLPGHKIEELAAGEEIKAREFSCSAQVYLLMLGQLAHVFSLNELSFSLPLKPCCMAVKQVKTYLIAMNLPLGLLINFGMEKLVDGYVRVVNGFNDSYTPST